LCYSCSHHYRSWALLSTILLVAGFTVASSTVGTAFAAAICAPPSAAPPICLTGTILSAELRIAMLEEAGRSGVEGHRLGDTIGDWQIVAITQRSITLQQAGNTVQIGLSAAQPAAPTPVPAIVPAGHPPTNGPHEMENRGNHHPQPE
jgi:hypothetical protein